MLITFNQFNISRLGSWITITSIFNELSIMVDDLPEGWAIASYLTLTIQIANIGPFIYSFIPKYIKTKRFIVNTTYGIFLLAFASIILLALFWNKTVMNRSVYLIVFTFGTSLSDCMTSMTYWVMVSWFPSKYISWLIAGESSSGIIASIVIWIQQSGTDNPRFSVGVYFLLISLVIPVSVISFYILLYKLNNGDYATANTSDLAVQFGDDINKNINIEGNIESLQNKYDDPNITNSNNISFQYYRKYFVILSFLSGIQNGMIPSLSTYMLLSYNNTVYVTSSTMSNITNPLFSLMVAYLDNIFVNNIAIYIMTAIFSFTSVYQFIISLCSPNPWGTNSSNAVFTFACIVNVFIYIIGVGMISSCKAAMITLIKKNIEIDWNKSDKMIKLDDINKIYMEYVGIFVQIGSLIGSLLFFCLVNTTNWFNQ